MSGNGGDRDLGALFEDARQADRQAVPPFETTWREAGRRAAAPGRRRAALGVGLSAALATAAIAAIVLLVRDHRGGGPSFSAEEIAIARAISDWTAPSDAITSVSGVRVSVEIPRLEIESVELPAAVATGAAGAERPAPPTERVP